MVPNLQALPPDWDGDPRSAISSMSAAPAKTDSNSGAYTVAHPVDQRPVETYFYEPPRGDYSKVSRITTMSPGIVSYASWVLLKLTSISMHTLYISTQLNAFGARNKESLGELLAGFFRHFGAADFQYADNAVSIRSGGVVDKLLKAEMDCW